MSTPESKPLTERKCKACEGGVDKLTSEQSRQLLTQVPMWNLDEPSSSIERKWTFKNFVEAIEFINRVAELAEAEQHHPDLHLTGYRHVRVVLTTHAIGGLSDNDFIVAAKLDAMSP
ncbi:MAG: 4a-hydroxytetrahydrobiopterin dehydratase [Planctomycetaceae bacterium]